MRDVGRALDEALERFPDTRVPPTGLRARLALWASYPLMLVLLADLALVLLFVGTVLGVLEQLTDWRAGRCVHGRRADDR